VEEAEDATKGADILITTTSSTVPLVMDNWISPGMHINCIGADVPGRQELDPAILKRARIVVDDKEQASYSGEINVPLSQGKLKPKDIWSELGEIVADLKREGQTTTRLRFSSLRTWRYKMPLRQILHIRRQWRITLDRQ
jgi:alanine dehydrogenase